MQAVAKAHQYRAEELFVCPITHEPLRDPVVASDGNTYERKAIEEWLSRGKTTSPLTGLPLNHFHLTDNRMLRELIPLFEAEITTLRAALQRTEERLHFEQKQRKEVFDEAQRSLQLILSLSNASEKQWQHLPPAGNGRVTDDDLPLRKRRRNTLEKDTPQPSEEDQPPAPAVAVAAVPSQPRIRRGTGSFTAPAPASSSQELAAAQSSRNDSHNSYVSELREIWRKFALGVKEKETSVSAFSRGVETICEGPWKTARFSTARKSEIMKQASKCSDRAEMLQLVQQWSDHFDETFADEIARSSRPKN